MILWPIKKHPGALELAADAPQHHAAQRTAVLAGCQAHPCLVAESTIKPIIYSALEIKAQFKNGLRPPTAHGGWRHGAYWVRRCTYTGSLSGTSTIVAPKRKERCGQRRCQLELLVAPIHDSKERFRAICDERIRSPCPRWRGSSRSTTSWSVTLQCGPAPLSGRHPAGRRSSHPS